MKGLAYVSTVAAPRVMAAVDMEAHILLWSWVQPASVNVWKPGRHRSHLSPVTPGLQLQRPELSHRTLREPVTHKEGEKSRKCLA
jgi:hypothetical protein